MTERFEIITQDGVTLESRIDSPEHPERMTVFCHPHPLQGGTMLAPLMISVTSRLVERGHRVLRFNFRGTGGSTGTHDFGEGEQYDVDAAIAHARGHELSLGVTGWSFGAATALRWLAEAGSNVPYAGIAPAPQLLPDGDSVLFSIRTRDRVPEGPKRFILGSRDQLIDNADVEAYAADKGVEVVTTDGDHFFHGRGKTIGDLVGEALEVSV